MPNGVTHDRITLTCLPIIGGVTLLVTQNPGIALSLSSSFLFSGLMFGPDLDIHSVQFKRWGPLRWIWLPYRKSLQHRSWLSHGPIVGTILRLLYLGCWIVLFSAVTFSLCTLNHWTSLIWQNALGTVQTVFHSIFERHTWEIWASLAGLELGAMSHSVSDGLGSAWSRRKRKRLARRSRLHP
jgi:uncharacterized metal-binding protein